MAKSKSSHRWLREHFNDPFVKRTQQDGYRSRASYKLLELQEKDRLLKPGMTVLDLGAAPGGWSQVAAEFVGEKGKVIASDILPMDAIAGVEFIEGDFTEEGVLQDILNALGDRQADLVMSDMAPNMSGVTDIDQPKSMYLVELALDLAKQTLNEKGTLVTKVFQGEGFEAFYQDLRRNFQKVVSRKPTASRARSRELYVVAKGLKAR
ncbi:23S rRNA (uridine(2552)-2'-O)-methyltransferase RlmE [Gilvimarinus sp. F26214L]|uniref:23S rRNA (uridine(2552)-2'-O)-methyltransferase RlmE n=1 Tax=Gilvimarinus sp. DZF01 TaxID=3461371 RepID=UPI0040465D94